MLAQKRKKHGFGLKKQTNSGLASFIQRPIPEEDEVVNFEKAVGRELRDQEIDSHLLDVYSDKQGAKVDVSKMNIKKRPGVFWRFLKKAFFFSLILGLGYFIYSNYFQNNNDISSLSLDLSAPERVSVAEEFYYEIEYFNPTKFVFSEIYLEMQYPDNFIFDSANLNSVELSPENGNFGFNLKDLAAGERATLKIKGYLLNVPESVNLAVARLTYIPGTFSSHFKKEVSASTIISDLGFLVDTESSGAVFVNQENELKLFFSGLDNKLLNNELSEFDVFFEFSENSSSELLSATSSISFLPEDLSSVIEKVNLEKLGAFSYRAKNFSTEFGRQELNFKYKVKNKIDDFEIKVGLRKRLNDKEYIFWQKTLKPELVSNDLSLNLILNASKNDQALDFGSTLNYTLNYENKGNKSYKDVVIMAILEGLALNFDSLDLISKGERSLNAITWSKNEIGKLAEIKAGESGELNFSIKLKDFNSDFLGKDLTLSAYAQYSVSGQEIKANENLSNKITNKINSDLSLKEELRYFNEDNYPVGSGPLPFEVNAKTEFRVYWTIENNMHELRDLKAVFNLPAYLNFSGKEDLEIGSISYNEETRQITWDIGLLPTSKYLIKGSFALDIIPREDDRDKILVLSPGSTISALDSETGGLIIKKTSPKTSRLEDDDIAVMNNNGRVK